MVKGMVAGGTATAVLSAVMLLIGATGFEPQLELTHILMSFLGVPTDYTLGWILYFVVGSVMLGGLFAYIEPRLGANTHTKSGILYSVITWLIVMLVFMPAIGAGYFGFQLSLLAPVVVLVQQLVYGAVLGWTYGRLSAGHNSFTKHHPA